MGVVDPIGYGNCSLHHHVQTDTAAHTASYPLGTESTFNEGNTVVSWSWAGTYI